MPVITWGQLAIDCRKFLKTESPVYVAGSLETPLDTKTGRCGRPRIRATEVQFLEKTSTSGKQYEYSKALSEPPNS
jgi:single-stranded DNA-binding protein